MENKNLIPAIEFCHFHEVDPSFINSLGECGLLEIIYLEEKPYLPADSLKNVEKMIHLHYELDINVEGVEAISHLLQRVDQLYDELKSLKNELSFYRKPD